MARRRRSRRNRRYRRSRLTVPLRILSFLLICGAIVAALILFFRVRTITVEGNERYSDQEILDATGIETGDNMFLLNKYAISGEMMRQLPYIQTVQIRRNLPDGLVIRVTECESVAAVIQGDDVWLISDTGKLLERTDQAGAGALPRIEGCQLLLPTVSSTMELPADSPISEERLLELIDKLEGRGMLADVEWISCADEEILEFRYLDRFTVQLLYDADFDQKLFALEQIVEEYLEDNEKGTIILTMPDKGNFRPDLS